MDNQAKKIMNQQILGNQSENPYTDLVNNQQPQQQMQQPQQQMQQPQPQVNHQAAFEAQMRQQQQQQQQQIQQDNTYAFDQNGTYCRTGTLENGFIEVDLKSYRERGMQNRFIAFSIIGVLGESDLEEIRQRNGMASLMMTIDSEEQFNRFKQFVAGLNWND